jgi:hypothetical protein
LFCSLIGTYTETHYHPASFSSWREAAKANGVSGEEPLEADVRMSSPLSKDLTLTHAVSHKGHTLGSDPTLATPETFTGWKRIQRASLATEWPDLKRLGGRMYHSLKA